MLQFITILCLTLFTHCEESEVRSKRKCLDDLGCFSVAYPYFDPVKRPISFLPDERLIIDTKFLLYRMHGHFYTFRNTDASVSYLDYSGFNTTLGTKFIIPGFMSNFTRIWEMDLLEHLLKNEQYNIFFVDWNDREKDWYEKAVANSRVIGAEIAKFVEKLKFTTDISLDSIHLIGHGLGAHIAGYAGKMLNKIGRISGLDPAGYYFTDVDPIVRLHRNDASFVDVIHTNAAPNFFDGLGNTDSIAHIDFWPNGGNLQPGCPYIPSTLWMFLTPPPSYKEELFDLICNHYRAVELFIASIDTFNCNLKGIICDNWAEFIDGSCLRKKKSNPKRFILGINADRNDRYISNDASLNVFLNTSAEYPFCLRMNI